MELEKKMKEIRRYWRSAENKEVCKPYSLEMEQIRQKVKYYAPDAQKLCAEAKEKVVRWEYGTESYMHRGYYCPSPIGDIVLGNNKRGRILKRVTSRSHPVFQYGFDEDDNLIYVKNTYQEEVILYSREKMIGITVGKDGIDVYSECDYKDQKLVSYYTADVYGWEEGILSGELNKENYYYSENGLLESADLISLLQCAYPILQQIRFYFNHDEEGYLSEYYYNEFEKGKEIKDEGESTPIEIKIRRKV